ncbi:MAG: PDZ domain-containing protein [Bacteroidetes bacterium]|nr:PDZ domain-containing protein [Bacteroidota bacterium]
MKQYFLKISGMAAIVLLLHVSGFAQDEAESKSDKINNNNDELIIKRKGDKDSKVTIEIKNGEVFINGKPAEEYDDDNISVRKRRGRDEFFVMPPMGPHSPFRGGTWNYSGDDLADSKKAFLGVSTEKDEKGGVEIREVTKSSAAEKAGLKKGDIITKIDEVTIEDPEKLTETIRKHKPEDKVVVTFKRDGAEQKTTATLGKFNFKFSQGFNFKMPDMNYDFDFAPGRGGMWNNGSPKIGIKAQDTEDGKGVKVLDVDDESAASKAGLKEGDVITQFDGKEINSASQLAEVARAAKGKSSIKAKLIRAGKAQEVEIKIPKKLKTADL